MASIEYRGKGESGGSGVKPWRVQIRKKGYPSLQKSFRTEDEAKLWAHQVENGIETSKNAASVTLPKLPLSVWIERWMQEIGPTRQYFKKEIIFFKFWKEHLGNEIAIDLSPTKIEAVADELSKIKGRFGTNLSEASRKKYLLYLSSLYTTAMRYWKWAIFNPLTCVNLLRKDPNSPKNQIEKILGIENEFMKSFHFLISEKMKKENLSQRAAADKCEMTLHTFQCAISKDRNPTIKNLLKVCIGFDIKIKAE